MAMATVRFHRLAAAEYRAALAWYPFEAKRLPGTFEMKSDGRFSFLKQTLTRALFSRTLSLDASATFPVLALLQSHFT
jgi:hypothetical protein